MKRGIGSDMNISSAARRDTARDEKTILLLLFLFAIVNWVLLSLAEKIGPPDFYKLHEVAERLYSGDLKVGIIPPLFPLLVYPLGKLIGLFTAPTGAFIIAGRIISLAAGLGVIWFSYLLLKKIVGNFVLPAIVFLSVSPWFLKLLPFPITDMLYLFFVTAAFYAFFNKSPLKLSMPAVLGGVLTRYEGVLLILSGILNYFKLKRRYFYILSGILPLVLVAFLIFAPRVFDHLKDIILPQKSYLYIFQHPLEFFNVIYGNLLFFIPFEFPYFLKLCALTVLFIFFVYGVYRLFKINRYFTLSIVVYEFLFLVAKGYIDAADPEREFRRICSGLWIFFIIAFIGGYFLLKQVESRKVLKNIVFTGGGVFLIIVALYQERIGLPVLFPALLLLIPLLYPVKGFAGGKIPKVLAAVVLVVFVFQVYHSSYHKSEEYVVSYANKAAFVAARWLNLAKMKENAVVLSYTNNTMVNYYLIKERIEPKNIQWVSFTVPLRYTEENREPYKEFFFNELRKLEVDYIIFDNYVVQKPEFLGINDVQRLLYEERENEVYFRLKRLLLYKGKNVGYVLTPVHKNP